MIRDMTEVMVTVKVAVTEDMHMDSMVDMVGDMDISHIINIIRNNHIIHNSRMEVDIMIIINNKDTHSSNRIILHNNHIMDLEDSSNIMDRAAGTSNQVNLRINQIQGKARNGDKNREYLNAMSFH